MRTPAAGIASALTAIGSQPGYLVQITLPSGTFYLTDLDADFTFNGLNWVSSDLHVQGINWIAGTPQRGKLTLGDADLVWWTFALELLLQDSPISIWQAYASATNQAEPLWTGRIGLVTRGQATVECDLVLDTTTGNIPRRRVQNVIAQQYLLPAGKIIMVGGQKWELQRK